MAEGRQWPVTNREGNTPSTQFPCWSNCVETFTKRRCFGEGLEIDEDEGDG